MLIEAIKHAASQFDEIPVQGDGVEALRERLSALSERERQVLSGVVAGQPNKTIANELAISPRTVEVHRANIMAKMQARNLPGLVRMIMALDTAF